MLFLDAKLQKNLVRQVLVSKQLLRYSLAFHAIRLFALRMNYTFPIKLYPQNYTFPIKLYPQNYTFPMKSYPQNYTFPMK